MDKYLIDGDLLLGLLENTKICHMNDLNHDIHFLYVAEIEKVKAILDAGPMTENTDSIEIWQRRLNRVYDIAFEDGKRYAGRNPVDMSDEAMQEAFIEWDEKDNGELPSNHKGFCAAWLHLRGDK